MALATWVTITFTGQISRTLLIQYPVGGSATLYNPTQMAEITRILTRDIVNYIETAVAAELPEMTISG